MRKKLLQNLNWLLMTIMLVTLIPLTALAAPPPQAVACAEAYIVQADDWLSKIAGKFLGEALSYPVLVAATNQQHTVDETYAQITNPDLIEVGWKICVPDAETTQALLETEGATVTASTDEGGTKARCPNPIEMIF